MIFELITGFICGIIVSAVFPQFPKFVRTALNKYNRQKQSQEIQKNEQTTVKSF